MNESRKENEDFQDKVQFYLDNIKKANETYELKIESLDSEVFSFRFFKQTQFFFFQPKKNKY